MFLTLWSRQSYVSECESKSEKGFVMTRVALNQDNRNLKKGEGFLDPRIVFPEKLR